VSLVSSLYLLGGININKIPRRSLLVGFKPHVCGPFLVRLNRKWTIKGFSIPDDPAKFPTQRDTRTAQLLFFQSVRYKYKRDLEDVGSPPPLPHRGAGVLHEVQIRPRRGVLRRLGPIPGYDHHLNFNLHFCHNFKWFLVKRIVKSWYYLYFTNYFISKNTYIIHKNTYMGFFLWSSFPFSNWHPKPCWFWCSILVTGEEPST